MTFGMQTAVMYLINSLVSSPEVLDARIKLRKEFLDLDIMRTLEVKSVFFEFGINWTVC